MVCEGEVPDEHYVVGHLLTPLTLAVCYGCFSWRDTWDELAEAYFFDHVDRWKDLRRRGSKGPTASPARRDDRRVPVSALGLMVRFG